MGVDIDRFNGDVDSSFICSICNDVLEDPQQAPICEHAFCKICISQWLNTNQSCPLDRERLTISDLRPVSRILQHFLSKLTLTCNNQIHGCLAIVAQEELETHLLECSFDPKRLVSCNSGCGITISFGELANHNCVQSLRQQMKETSEILFGLIDTETENKNKMSEIESKLAGFQVETGEKMSNLVKKLERIEKENEDKMLMIESKLELLEAEMANIRISKSNSFHVESATLKQQPEEPLMSNPENEPPAIDNSSDKPESSKEESNAWKTKDRPTTWYKGRRGRGRVRDGFRDSKSQNRVRV
ncbi:E3 ubiquitin-protein ligase NRDP1-like isoform X2 [Artemia franciscana]|uniref:E3 ubiquitin-protein ligase NRDP1-like isoform X2 n=1 Tax=Artemia franciscana TaxID=6661 RepID=UPI0032DB2E03